MKTNLLRLIAIVFTCSMLIGCTDQDANHALFGTPTTIEAGNTPIDTVCRIQAAFRQLPKPLIKSMSYQAPWTSYNLGAASVDHRGYHKVQITEAGLEFLRQHSRLELVMSLTPLFAEAGIGGEAAALLAGIPAGNKSVQSGKTASIANALAKSLYRSPESPGSWYENAHQFYSRVTGLYGLANKAQSPDQDRRETTENSLEARIIEELRAFNSVPLKLLVNRPFMPQPHNEELVVKWIAGNEAPTLNEAALRAIQTDDRMFRALAWFPFYPEPRGSTFSRDETLMMYLLGVEQEYWPAVLQLSSGQGPVNQTRADFQELVTGTLSRLCI